MALKKFGVADAEKRQAIEVAGARVLVSHQGELIVRTAGKAAEMNRIRAALEAGGVKVLAASPHDGSGTGRAMLVVSDVARARTALEAAGVSCTTESVLLIEGQRQLGVLALLGQLLWSRGIGICHSYVSEEGRDNMAAVFKTTDNDRAFELLLAASLRWAGAAARAVELPFVPAQRAVGEAGAAA